jgi:hypothetical protein
MKNDNELETRLKQHFIEVLSIHMEMQLWPEEGMLPAFLRETYLFRTAKILEVPCLFVIDRGVHRNTPASIRKHLIEAGKRWQGEAVYVAVGIDSARRKQLIGQKVPFVVPGNQVYLPMLGIDLREHFRRIHEAVGALSPATQAAFLYVLYEIKGNEFFQQGMAAALGYTSMTISRAFDELESTGIGKSFVRGRRRVMELNGPPRDLWEKALPVLRSPVLQRVQVPALQNIVNAPAAGLTALASYTDLAEPDISVAALARTEWHSYRNESAHGSVGRADSPISEVEVWSYHPLVRGPVVDRLSLYLSLRGTVDERVEKALHELLEGMNW